MTIVSKTNPILELLKNQSPSSQGLAASELSAATSFQDIISLLCSKTELSLSDVTGKVGSNSSDVLSSEQLLTSQMLQKFYAYDETDPSDLAPEEALNHNKALADKFVEMLKQEIGLNDVDASIILQAKPDLEQPSQNILLSLISERLSEHTSTQKSEIDFNIKTEQPYRLPVSFRLNEADKNLFRSIPIIEANLNLDEGPAITKYVMQFEPLLKDLPSSADKLTTAKLFVEQTQEKTDEKSELSFLKVDIKIDKSLISVKTFSEKDDYNHKVIRNEGLSNLKSIVLDLDISKINAFLTNIEFDGFDLLQNNNPPELTINFLRTGQAGITNLSARSIQPSGLMEPNVKQIVIDQSHVALVTEKIPQNGVLLEEPVAVQYASTLHNTDEITSDLSPNVVSLNNETRQQLLANINSVISGEYGLKQLHKITKDDFLKDQTVQNLEKLIKEISVTPVLTKISPKVKLLTTTADVLKMRNTAHSVDKKTFPIKNLPTFAMDQLDSQIKMETGYVDFGSKKDRSENTLVKQNIETGNFERFAVAKLNQNTPSITGNSSLGQHTNLSQTFTPNFLDLYDVKIGSRLGMMLTEQVLSGKENFEIQLEPKSFGKVRVNVLLENSSIDIKMVAENSAVLSVLRSSEGILQNIAEQNGLKLSDYSVDMQNNNQPGDNRDRHDLKSEKGKDLIEDTESNQDHLLQFNENSNSLNLLA